MAARTKGSTVHSTLAFITARYGADCCDRVLQSLPPEEQRAIRLVTPTEEIAYERVVHLWDAIERQLAGVAERGDWADAAGAASIGSYGVQLYGGILRKATPRDFLTQSISLFRLYYQPGDMEVVADTPGQAVLRLVGFDARTRLFCRRLTGGLREAVSLAGGEAPSVRHVRCAIDGDAFCEWELRWHVDLASAGGGAASSAPTGPAGARAAT